MGINKEDATSFEEMANEMDSAPEAVAEATEEVTEETTEEGDTGVTDETPAE